MTSRSDIHSTRWTRRLGVLAATAVLMVGGVAGCSDDDGDAKSTDTTRPGGNGQVIGSGDKYEATIRRAGGGVPHISGDSIDDVAFGQGYASGEDRTCDLADQLVKIRGERSKWYGAGEDDANLNSDIAWRAIGIHQRATEEWPELSEENRAIFEAFTAGWNSHLETVGVDKLTGWCKGQPWVKPIEASDAYAYARAVVLLASSGQLARYIATAQPPASPEATTTTTPAPTTATSAPSAQNIAPVPTGGVDLGRFAESIEVAAPEEIGSNGWAIGTDRSTSGGGMLVANPHFPWEGELRFWESHLTVNGKSDIYGVQLSGLPGIGIGFTDDYAWTHTVSAGNRFTAYRLALQPGSPTTYRYGDEWREMTSTTHEIEVKGADGKVATEEHTTWASHYGPIIDFPGFGWTESATISFRDANIDNDEFVEQYFGMLEADTFDDFVDVMTTANGVPLFNTVATSADGRAWYADTSATPNLSAEALAAYETSLATDPIVKIAADSRAVLLDGSDPMFEWVDEPGARDPGLVPASRQPRVERSDYVFNANDSFWMPHATALLTGDYSPLHGRQETVRSPRTRENAVTLDDTTAAGPSGADGTFDLDELAAAALLNRSFTADELREPVVARCQAVTGPVDVPAMEGTDTAPGLPAAKIDISKACSVLADWDGIYDLDRSGPPLWREFMLKFPATDVMDQGTGTLWAEPFDPARPVDTPSGLAPAPVGAPDPVLVNLARAVQALEVGGFEPGVKLSDVQFTVRNGERIAVHGGTGVDGTTNVVSSSARMASILDPVLTGRKSEQLVANSAMFRLDGETGTPIDFGSSFFMALAFGKDGPEAKAFLVYGNNENRQDPNFTAATKAFADKKWRTIEFREPDIAKGTTSTVTVRG
ncbi:MAG: penicillin acylase family protein [Microthrixaceae bacterium]|nr:penicillin acylase family protein [Acidimicrobiales bacterium]MCB9403189.1 penicillin acylase family protein [Microthrixaceae bacterium]